MSPALAEGEFHCKLNQMRKHQLFIEKCLNVVICQAPSLFINFNFPIEEGSANESQCTAGEEKDGNVEVKPETTSTLLVSNQAATAELEPAGHNEKLDLVQTTYDGYLPTASDGAASEKTKSDVSVAYFIDMLGPVQIT